MVVRHYARNSGDLNSLTGQMPCRRCDRQRGAHRCAPSCGVPNCRYCRNISGTFCIRTMTWFVNGLPFCVKAGRACKGISAKLKKCEWNSNEQWKTQWEFRTYLVASFASVHGHHAIHWHRLLIFLGCSHVALLKLCKQNKCHINILAVCQIGCNICCCRSDWQIPVFFWKEGSKICGFSCGTKWKWKFLLARVDG